MDNLLIKDKRKIPTDVGIIIMDGLVSTGKQISLHNIKNNFSELKRFCKEFY